MMKVFVIVSALLIGCSTAIGSTGADSGTIKRIFFIDKSVANIKTTVYKKVNIDDKIYVIDKNNPFSEMASILKNYKNLEAIHIITHGNDGAIFFNGIKYNANNILQAAAHIHQIGGALKKQGDILLYGCNLSLSHLGKRFVKIWSDLTDADVAASNNTTGHNNLLGDWNLEYAVGNINSPVLNLAEWKGSLQSDYGDAPSSYGNPSHTIVSGFSIGTGDADAEASGLHNVRANGDDANNVDDENGVVIPRLKNGTASRIDVTVNGAGGFLQAWVDWNGNGVFDLTEQIALNLRDDGANGDITANDGTININVSTPANAVNTNTYARFRWSGTANLNSTDAATDGEVEDEMLYIWPDINTVTSFGSCPTNGFLTIESATKLFGVSFGSGSITQLSATNLGINAAGYNPLDGRIYARVSSLVGNANDSVGIVAFGDNGTYAFYGPNIPGMPASQGGNVGDVDGNGYLHITAAGAVNSVAVVDVTPSRSTFMTVVRTYTRTFSGSGITNANIGVDMAYSPSDGVFYSVLPDRRIVSLHPNTGVVTLYGTADANLPSVAFGSQYMFADRQLVVMSNTTGLLYRIDLNDPALKTYYVGNSNYTNQTNNDGAGCPLLTFSQALPVIFDKITASVSGNILLVDWNTLSERNNSHFQIQVSKDGKTFHSLGRVDSKALNGFSDHTTAYHFEIDLSSKQYALGLAFLLIGMAALKNGKPRKWLFTLAVSGLLCLGIISCNKENSPLINIDEDMYIRIAQFDIDGTVKYSNPVKAVKN